MVVIALQRKMHNVDPDYSQIYKRCGLLSILYGYKVYITGTYYIIQEQKRAKKMRQSALK